jgi:hypothetical protein
MAQVLSDRARSKIAKDYGIVNPRQSPIEFVHQVVEEFGQVAEPASGGDPLGLTFDDRAVFRAAVWSLGSNSRDWMPFKRKSDELEEVLHGYDPVATHHDVTSGDLTANKLTTFLRGSTGSRDAKAIAEWARRLTVYPNYYDVIRDVGRAFNALHGAQLEPQQLLPCVVSYFANPLARWPGEKHLTRAKEIAHPPTVRSPAWDTPSAASSCATCTGPGSSPTSTSHVSSTPG